MKFVIMKSWIVDWSSDGQAIIVSCPIAAADTIESADEFVMNFEPDEKIVSDRSQRRGVMLFREIVTETESFNLIVKEVVAI